VGKYGVEKKGLAVDVGLNADSAVVYSVSGNAGIRAESRDA